MFPSVKNTSLLLALIFIFVSPCSCAPKHRHRRHLYALQSRHKTMHNSNPKPVEFSGSLKDLNALNDQDKSKLLHGLQNYIVKYAPDLILSKRPSITKVGGTVTDDAIVNISIHTNASGFKATTERESINLSLQLTKIAKQKVEMALTPQFSILKRKMAKTAREKSTITD